MAPTGATASTAARARLGGSTDGPITTGPTLGALIGWLAITNCVKKEVEYRKEFYDKVDKRIRKTENKKRADSLLGGLK